MQGAVAGQACKRPVEGYPWDAALFLGAGDFPGEATTNVAFHVEEGKVLESLASEYAGIVGDARNGLTLFDSSVWATSTNFETSFHVCGNWDSDEGSLRDLVCGRFS